MGKGRAETVGPSVACQSAPTAQSRGRWHVEPIGATCLGSGEKGMDGRRGMYGKCTVPMAGCQVKPVDRS